METSSKVTLFEDIFEVTALNPDGYKFDRVNRLQATGTTFECDLLLDINCEIYSVKETDKITLVLASTLHLDGSPADHFSYVPVTSMMTTSAGSHPVKEAGASGGGAGGGGGGGGGMMSSMGGVGGQDEPSLADNYEYVMHGRVFEMTYKKDGTVVIAISYGGLLMRLTGDQRHLTNIQPDQRLYLLLKKD
jgi:DNA-directed RNA polymerases I, II, and III subunit RPABC3